MPGNFTKSQLLTRGRGRFVCEGVVTPKVELLWKRSCTAFNNLKTTVFSGLGSFLQDQNRADSRIIRSRHPREAVSCDHWSCLCAPSPWQRQPQIRNPRSIKMCYRYYKRTVKHATALAKRLQWLS